MKLVLHKYAIIIIIIPVNKPLHSQENNMWGDVHAVKTEIYMMPTLSLMTPTSEKKIGIMTTPQVLEQRSNFISSEGKLNFSNNDRIWTQAS